MYAGGQVKENVRINTVNLYVSVFIKRNNQNSNLLSSGGSLGITRLDYRRKILPYA